MEKEITSQEEAHAEKHYGRIVALIITVAILGFIVWYGVTGKLLQVGKVTVVVSQKEEAPMVAITAGAPPAPVEAFVITDIIKTNAIAKTNGTIDTKTLTAPVNFKSFAYDASVGKTISVSGTCHDTYYALLIFESKDDYRTNPGSARSNRAFQCGASKLFTIKMDLRDINLSSGSYYLFVADQGSKGSWYNPR